MNNNLCHAREFGQLFYDIIRQEPVLKLNWTTKTAKK